MDWFWKVLLFCGGCAAGWFIFGVFTIQALTAIRCAFPMLKAFEPYRYCFDIEACRRLFRFSVVVNLSITAAVIGMCALWAPDALKMGVYVSMVIMAFIGFEQSGMNANNIDETIQVIGRRVYPGKEDELFMAYVKLFGKY